MKKKLTALLMMLLVCVIGTQGAFAAEIGDTLIIDEPALYEEHTHTDECVHEDGEMGIQPTGLLCGIGIHGWSSWTQSYITTSKPGYCYYESTTSKRSCDCGKTEYKEDISRSRAHAFTISGGIVYDQTGRPFRVWRCACGASMQEPA